GRPVNNEKDRAEVLAALDSVDLITIFPDVRATQLLKLVRPAVYAKGGDYTAETLNEEERAALDEVGAEIRIIPFERGYSTSRIIQQLGAGPS
ncbi:MAG TPA: ADP-heptose synthase, partial [Chthoniobacterales bacterium]